MSMTMQIFPITEIRDRARDAADDVSMIEVVQGHVVPGSRVTKLVIKNIRRNGDGSWPEKDFQVLERYNGQYTATFKPGKETLFVDSESSDDGGGGGFNFGYGAMPMFQQQNKAAGSNPLQGSAYEGKSIMQLVEKIMDLESRNKMLNQKVKDLEEDLQQFQTAGGKFTYALNGFFEQTIMPLIMKDSRPIQGSFNNSNHNQMEWTKLPINERNGDGGMIDTFEILVQAFGQDKLIQIAKKLQQDPSLVQKLLIML